MRVLGAVVACLAAGGCLSSPDRGGGDGGAPDGDGGTIGGDAGAGEACGTLRALRDDFEAGELDQARWFLEDGTIDGGAVELSVNESIYNAFLTSRPAYRTSGGEVQLELVLDAFDSRSLFTVWLRGVSSSVGLQVDGDLVKLAVDDGDGISFPGSTGFTVEHVFWRLWESEGRVYAEVSVDGGAWEAVGDVAWEEPLAQLDVWLELRDAPASTVAIRSVNQGLPPAAHCAASTFTDEFDDLERWLAVVDPTCSVGTDGALSLSNSESGSCLIASRERFALHGGAVAVELTAAGDCAPSPILSLSWGGGFAELACVRDGEKVRLVASTEAGEGSAVDYDPSGHRFLRLRHEPMQDAVVWETHAAVGGDWEQFDASAVSDDALLAVEVRLSLSGGPSVDPVDGATFDKLNLAP